LSNLFRVDENRVPVLNECRYWTLNRGWGKIKYAMIEDSLPCLNIAGKILKLNFKRARRPCGCYSRYVLWPKIVLNNQIICDRRLSMNVTHSVGYSSFFDRWR
jgi:hypothetical protein